MPIPIKKKIQRIGSNWRIILGMWPVERLYFPQILMLRHGAIVWVV